MQTSAKKASFQFDECSLSYAKKQKKSQKASVLVLFFLFFSKYVTKRTLVSIFFISCVACRLHHAVVGITVHSFSTSSSKVSRFNALFLNADR